MGLLLDASLGLCRFLMPYICLLLVCASITTMYFTYQVYPEIGMVVNSQCNNPIPNWNGKVMNVPIWKSGFENRDETHNSYTDTTADRRLEIYNRNDHLISSDDAHMQRLLAAGFTHENALKMVDAERKKEPIIIWGSHHKTGTYVAQKAFSHTCKRMNWCCIFHVTRDSIHVIEDTLRNEGEHIRVIGHTQWIWDPKEIGISNYRFIHLVRKPYKKILSGYRYHKDGAEAWCLKQLPYDKACDMSYKEVQQAIVPYTQLYERPTTRNLRLLQVQEMESTASRSNRTHSKPINSSKKGKASSSDANKKHPPLWLKRDDVQSYCQSVHLCEPCCRREHEVNFATDRAQNAPVSDSWVDPKKRKPSSSSHSSKEGTEKSAHRSLNIDGADTVTNIIETSSNTRKYARHAQSIYDFQCRNLGPMSNLSLTDTLKMVPPTTGLKVEASIDYYENLRMARIYNATFKDPLSLNIDLDDLMVNYDENMMNIILHIDIDLPSQEQKQLAKELSFFDVNNSPMYRYSMTNPFVNHVDTKSASESINYKALLESDAEVRQIYTHINDLMYSLYHPAEAPQSAALKRISNKIGVDL